MPHLVPAVLVLEGVKYCRGYSVFPNIWGKGQWTRGGGGSDSSGPQVFSSGSVIVQKGGTSQTDSAGIVSPGDIILEINASLSNQVYGASETVQPAGLYGLYLIRSY